MSNNPWINSIIELVYPKYCVCCGRRISYDIIICLSCEIKFPKTGFYDHSENIIAKTFWGRTKVESAASAFFLSKNSKISKAIYALKYSGNIEVGHFLGKLLANELMKYPTYIDLDCIIPVPLSPSKLKLRGYNQCKIIAEGFTGIWPLIIEEDIIIRKAYQRSQTSLGRWARYKNVKDAFELTDHNKLAGKKVLVIDDVITTGGTLEALSNELLKIPGIKIFIASLAFTLKN